MENRKIKLIKINIMENNQVTKSMNFNEIMSLGKAFAESGMFADTKSAAQAIVKIQAGQEIGIPPFAAMTGINIIMGKPTVGAGLIAARVKGYGKYDYKVIEHNDKLCSIDFFRGKDLLGNSTFTIEDARKAGTKNMDKFPKNMLFARCISNGVKWFCPDIFSAPVYVPEEMEDSPKTEDTTYTEINGKKELQEEYFNLLNNSGHVLSREEQEAMLLNKKGVNYLQWNEATLTTAIDNLTKLILARENKLLDLEFEKQQQASNETN